MDRDAQLVLSLPADPGATFETFVTPPNEPVVHHLRELARPAAEERPGPRQVFLWGPPGTGKSHLLQAFCRAAAERGARTAMVPLGELLGAGPAVLEGLGELDVVCVDELDLAAGDRGWELALFSLIDTSRGHGARLVLGARRPPRALALHLPDLASRLLWGAVHRLSPLDDNGRGRALQAHARLRGFRLPDEVVGYLMRHGPRDMGRLMELLGTLDRRSLVHKRRITVPLVREVLGAATGGASPQPCRAPRP